MFETNKDNMHWGFNPRYYRFIFLLTFLLYFMSDMRIVYKLLLFVVFSVLWLYFFFKYKNFEITIKTLKKLIYDTLNYDAHSIGSAWCHIASAGAPFLYLIQYLI